MDNLSPLEAFENLSRPLSPIEPMSEEEAFENLLRPASPIEPMSPPSCLPEPKSVVIVPPKPRRDRGFKRCRPSSRESFSRESFVSREGPLPPYFHARCRAVLCIQASGFTLTNGFVSFTMDDGMVHPSVIQYVQQLKVGKLIFTDETTKRRFKTIVQTLPQHHPLHALPTYLLDPPSHEETCPECTSPQCHRHVAIRGIRQILNAKPEDVEPIPHPSPYAVLRF